MEGKFEKLLALNVNDKTEKRKDGKVELTYLSWAWAWSEFKKVYPEAIYEIIKFKDRNGDNLVPYMYDENTGYMVMTSVTAGGLTYEMWLPVMNSANKAMKSISYEYDTKYNGKKSVEAATMFDINKTLMRCLVKNLAMFGLGLYIYAGEDLPEGEEPPEKVEKTTHNAEPKEHIDVSNAGLVLDLKQSKTMKALLEVYNSNKAKIESTPELKSIFKQVKQELVSNM